MKVFLIGATGAVGTALLRELLDDEEVSEIRVLARRAPAIISSKIVFKKGSLEEILQQADFIEGDHVFCCIGSTIRQAGSAAALEAVDRDAVLRVARMAAMKGISGFSVISASGARVDSPFHYFRMKGELEQELQRIPFASLFIYRPGLLVATREKKRWTEIFARPLLNFLGKFNPRLRPVPVSLVARQMRLDAKKRSFGKFFIENEAFFSQNQT